MSSIQDKELQTKIIPPRLLGKEDIDSELQAWILKLGDTDLAGMDPRKRELRVIWEERCVNLKKTTVELLLNHLNKLNVPGAHVGTDTAIMALIVAMPLFSRLTTKEESL